MPQFRRIGQMLSAASSSFGGAGGGIVVPSFLTGFTAANTVNAKKVINDVKNGVGSRHIAFCGNSTKAGWGANGTSFGVPTALLDGSRRALGQGTQWAGLLAAKYGITVSVDNFWGDAGWNIPFSNLTTFDPRISITGTVSFSSTLAGPGGRAWLTQDTTSTITFTPGSTFTSLTLFYGSTGQTFNIKGDNDPTSYLGIAGSGNGAATKTTFNFSAPCSSVTFKGTTATGFRILGGFTETAGRTVLHLQNMGWGNSITTQWASTSVGAAPRDAINLLAPSLIMFGEDINDPNTGVSATTHTTNLTNFFNNVKKTGTDVILYMDHFSASLDVDGVAGHATLANILATQTASRTVASNLGIPLVDTPSVYQSYARQKTTLGFMYDVSHFLSVGQTDQATNILMPMAAVMLAA